MSNPQEWWIRRDGNATGPFSAKQLKQAALSGTISPQTPIRLSGREHWMPAGDVAGLFTSPAKPEVDSQAANPYASPTGFIEAPVAAAAAALPAIERNWFVVHATAWVMLGVATLNLMGFFGTAIAFLMGNIATGEIDSPAGFALVPLVAVLTVAGSIGALRRKKWRVGLLAAMTFVHCCLVMMLILGDSFSACWKSFESDPTKIQ